MKNPRVLALSLALCLASASAIVTRMASGQAGLAQNRGAALITPERLREYLTYISSDDLEGRNTFSEGLGLAAAYIADRIKEAGVKPGGDHGTYFQRVSVLGVKSTNRSTLTVEVNGRTRTFRNGEGASFPKNVGGKQTVTLNQVEFVGYGLHLDAGHNDYKGLDVKGKAVVWLGTGPRAIGNAQRFIGERASLATDEMGALATIGPATDRAFGAANEPAAGGGRGGARELQPDFTTVQNLDLPQKPEVIASDELLEFLFSAADMKYADLKAKADAREESLPRFVLKGVKLTFNIDADYQVVNTRYTRNIVGIVEGTDPQLKNTYVAFGAHYDHLGYMQGVLPAGQTDRIFNGADDDGSGTATIIALARAFALGPKPKRSLLFVWHAGEERGLYGSRYFADYPEVPIDRIVTQLNIDMIGRNKDNLESESNAVYAVGSDRISTELHNILVGANESLSRPLRINYDMNDSTDPERIYYRSDHFSYAAKGIPIIFFFTGLHPDYHRVSDSIEKIDFEKMSHIAQLVYTIGWNVANLDHPPARDFLGPRMGKGSTGRLSIR